MESTSLRRRRAAAEGNRGESEVSISATQSTVESSGPIVVHVGHVVSQKDGVAEQLSSVELLRRMNKVCVQAALTTIPAVETTVVGRVRPSQQSREFAEQRAVEIAAGVTPFRRKQLHRKMGRMRRRDYLQWHRDYIT